MGAHGLALHRLVGGQIRLAEAPRIAGVALHTPDDVARDRAAVESIGTRLRYLSQHLRHRRVLEPVSDGLRRAIGPIEKWACDRILDQLFFLFQLRVQSGADGKALLGQCDGRLKQAGPGQLPIGLVRLLKHTQDTGNTNRQPANHRLLERHRFAIFLQKQFFVGCRWRRLPPVQRQQFHAVPMQQESATGQAAGLRLHQPKHHLHGDGSIHRRPARFENLIARVGRQWIGSSDSELRRRPTRLDARRRCDHPLRWHGIAKA